MSRFDVLEAMPEDVTFVTLTSREAAPYLIMDGEEELTNSILNIERKAAIDNALQILTEKEREIIIHRFGLFGTDPKTFELIAWNSQALGYRHQVTIERIRQIQIKALSKLKHPSAAKYMKDLY